MFNCREFPICSLLPEKIHDHLNAHTSFGTFYGKKCLMSVTYLDSNLEYKFTVLDFSQCKSYTSSNKPVVNQYFLPKSYGHPATNTNNKKDSSFQPLRIQNNAAS